MKKAGSTGGPGLRKQQVSEPQQPSRAERRRALRQGQAGGAGTAQPGWRGFVAQRTRTTSFRIAAGLFLFGPLFLLVSQTVPHDYGFLELGGLFTLSVYDIVLAILGLSVGSAMAETTGDYRAIVIAFSSILFVMLIFFDTIFQALMQTPLGDVLYLVAPIAVASVGASLWLAGAWRRYALIAAAALTAFSMGLFIGFDDLGVGIADFASGAFFCAVWLLVAPSLLLRQFRGEWLKIPSRIVGSWLMVIAVIVTVSLYMPMPVIAPPPPSSPDDFQSVPLQGDLPPLPEDEGGEE